MNEPENSILGTLVRHHEFALEELQRNSWTLQISILKERFSTLEKGYILFEYSIPRMGKRVDVVLLLHDVVFVLEFKVGTGQYEKYATDQALDYALDLKNFHEQSHDKKIVPIVVATEAIEFNNTLDQSEDSVFSPLKANKHNLLHVILSVPTETNTNIDASAWEESIYKPTPTIIEAAQALYKGHSVKEISRADSGTINLSKTSDAISKIIDDSKLNNDKSICFITDQSDTAYMFAFLTKHPVVFYSNKNLEYLINSEESEIKKYGYCNLKYFKNREKVGAIISQAEFASEKINKIKNNLKKYELSISELKKEIRYLGKSKKKFIEEINKLLFNN